MEGQPLCRPFDPEERTTQRSSLQPFVLFVSLNHAFGIIFYENYLSLRFQVVNPDVSHKGTKRECALLLYVKTINA